MLVFLNETPLYLKCPRRERLESLELSNANQEISCTRLHFLFKERGRWVWAGVGRSTNVWAILLSCDVECPRKTAIIARHNS
ncbi:hypothetical protein POPTR_014G027950v4 [Populus trichocarpa]|uniref:Uncharacterized protein n=1 Tax=Populus trichocarpa TaxID=3694 RepID=A0ACC0RXE6_POPTR|nr:hypothetical protein POPTR_014G027950v4 [Populus trichocarpa]